MNAGAVASPSSSSPEKRKSSHGKSNTGVPKAIDVYRNLRVVELDSVTDAALAPGNCEQDLEIQALVEQMVLAVANAAELGQAKKTKGPRNPRTTSGDMAAAPKKKEDKSPTPNNVDNMAASKRKRGRPKKIQRAITTSDSVNGSEAPRKRGRPRKSPVMNKDAGQGAEQDTGGTFKHPPLDGEETTLEGMQK
ncbi:hypothetical protein ACHAW5_006326 [Stephanodiscus triporus]|uniref:Uncharacterized protein n=1 Tax=Stephanodiscus triporus TaxID=2934178 RepID=A0ABD3MHP3_9STRA